jgi:hypothetical protein
MQMSSSISRSASGPLRKPYTSTQKYSGCFAATGFTNVPIGAGQEYQILANGAGGLTCNQTDPSLDNQWSVGGPTPLWSGPTGIPVLDSNALMPNIYLGTLIGAISDIDAGTSAEEATMRQIFSTGGFVIGFARQDTALITGWLYLSINDSWSFADNLGSIPLEVNYLA